MASRLILLAIGIWLLLPFCGRGDASELGIVPLFDGERSDALNLWGGPFGSGNIVSVSKQGAVVRTGTAAYLADLGSVPNGGFRFFQTFSSDLHANPAYRQDRNLARYDTLAGYVRNDTGTPLTLQLELKDYRDSSSHRAVRSYVLPAGDTWQPIVAPLDLAAGWSVTGTPDLSRAFAVSFLVNADFGSLSGSLYLDDFSLAEKGPAIDPATASLETIVDRLAHRQFDALWTARNRSSGIIPNTSDNVTTGAMNTTAGVVWMLPTAVRRGWVPQGEADSYMSQLVTSLHANRNQATYVPTRFTDLVTAAPVGDREESSIDAAFVALALHRYKSQPTTSPELQTAIDELQNRLNFAAFARPTGFNLAYRPASGFSDFTYSGYTHEGKVISLAAELSEDHHVPLADLWNADTGRVLAHLVDADRNHLVYSFGTDHRAPFAQALLNLFVDTSRRGSDNYPDRNLARNPWQNFVRYEAEVAARLEQLGREHFFQPDAAGGAAGYRPYNLYNDFGQPDLFMPWSVAFALMAGADNSPEALRFLLGAGLHGPLGMADSAQWETGAAGPTDVPSQADNWNMVLSTMALLEYLDGPDRASLFFAGLPEVRAALDTVFVAGDFDGDGSVDADDHAYWKAMFNSRTMLAGDGNNDGIIDAADYTVWRDKFAGGSVSLLHAVPEPATWGMLAWLAAAMWLARRKLVGRYIRRGVCHQ